MSHLNTHNTCQLENLVLCHETAIQTRLDTLISSWPLYASVDIRYAGFKIAVVDHNLFPAGFNNLASEETAYYTQCMRSVLADRIQGKSILLLCEYHTRNTWYLENIYRLRALIQDSGYTVTLSMIGATTTTVITAENKPLLIHAFTPALANAHDTVILNNDLTTGIPDSFASVRVPIIPNPDFGWHRRRKSAYFKAFDALLGHLLADTDCDPWLYSTLTDNISVDINLESDRELLYAKTTQLFDAIAQKYDAHGISEKPFVFIKSDQGTYGMGIHAIESPEAVLTLNRKHRNTLSTGKSAHKITQFLLQEGVPSVQKHGNKTAEACFYMLGRHTLGGFYRLHDQNSRGNLNKHGMSFSGLTSESMPSPVYNLHALLATIANGAMRVVEFGGPA